MEVNAKCEENGTDQVLLPSMLRVEAVRDGLWLETIAKLSAAIQAAGGFILDYQFFSNKLLSISFEVCPSQMVGLRNTMVAAGFCFMPKSMEALDRYCTAPETVGRPSENCVCHLAVTFFHNDPDIRMTVPAVPG